MRLIEKENVSKNLVNSLHESSSSSSTASRNQKLMEDIITFLHKNDMFKDIFIYTNGHRYFSEARPNAVELSVNGCKYYDEGEFDVKDYIEYNNPETVTMTFEGSFYDAYNSYGKIYDEFNKIGDKYGLYAEQGYAWSLAFYKR